LNIDNFLIEGSKYTPGSVDGPKISKADKRKARALKKKEKKQTIKRKSKKKTAIKM
jgi:hypothetical protein